MKKIKIASSKYDGTPRDTYEAWLAAEDAEAFTLYAPPGTRSFDQRKQKWFEAPDGLLEIYCKRHWFVIWHMCEKREATTNDMYVHIALPAQRHADTLTWVDLDLDYRWYADGRLVPLDEAEFAQHARTMHYPTAVIAQAQATFEAAGRLCAAQAGLFDHAAQVEHYRALKQALQNASRAGHAPITD